MLLLLLLLLLLFCVFVDRDGVEVHKHPKQKRAKPLSSHLDRTSSVNKGFIIWDKVHQKYDLQGYFLRNIARNPERTRHCHLARSASQSLRKIWFMLPALEAII